MARDAQTIANSRSASPVKITRAASSSTCRCSRASAPTRARTPEDTNWLRIAGLYEALALVAPLPIVELNHAVAIGMAFGPAVGLELLDELRDEPTLKDYHLLPSTRGDLLARLGRDEEARAEFERAAQLTRNERERVPAQPGLRPLSEIRIRRP